MVADVPDQRLADAIAEAAFDPAKWVDVCDGMGRVSGGIGALIVPALQSKGFLETPRSQSLLEASDEYVRGDWFPRDIRFRGVPCMLRDGYMTDAHAIGADEVARSPYYQDFLARCGLQWYVAVHFSDGEDDWCMSMQRPLGVDPASPGEIAAAMAYRPLLQNAASLAKALGHTALQSAAGILEQHGVAAIGIGWGNVSFVSPSAEACLATHLRYVAGRLEALHDPDRGPLNDLVTMMRSASFSGRTKQIVISNGGLLPPLVIYGCALPSRARDVFSPAVALLVIANPERPRSSPADLIRNAFSLSPSESRLAVALMDGESPENFAAQNGVSVVTVRNQVQSLLRKTDTHRQGELIARLSRILPPR